MSSLYIVMYHYVRDLKHGRYPGIKGLDTELFKTQIEYLKNHFTIVRMEEVIAAVQGTYTLPEKSVLLTFDDGYVDHFGTVFPILESAGSLQGSFFIPGKILDTHQLLDVNKIHYILASADINKLLPDMMGLLDHYRGTEFDYPSNEELFTTWAKANRFDTKETIFVKRILQTVIPEKLRNRISSDLFAKYVGITEEQLAYELYMSREQIRAMRRHGMFIGIHGYDHYWLGNLTVRKMQADVQKGLEVMGEFVDTQHWVMNYPYGSYNEGVLEYIRTQGACLGLTTEVAVADFSQHDILALPRFDCNDFPPKSENYRKSVV